MRAKLPQINPNKLKGIRGEIARVMSKVAASQPQLFFFFPAAASQIKKAANKIQQDIAGPGGTKPTLP